MEAFTVVGMFLLFAVLALLLFGIPAFAITHAVKLPEQVWRSTGKDKSLWILALVGSFTGFGVLVALYYLFAVRLQLEAEWSAAAPRLPD